MKIRTGFVSNSSSTSFTIAFVPEKNNLNLKTLDFLLSRNGNYISPVKLDMFRDTVGNRRKVLKEELKVLQEDRIWLQNRIDKLVECSQIPAVKAIFDALDNDYKHKNNPVKTIVESARYLRPNPKDPWNDTVARHIQNDKSAVKEIDKNIDEIKKQLELIKKLPKNTVIAKWKKDNMDDLLKDLVDMLEKDGRVVVLEKLVG